VKRLLLCSLLQAFPPCIFLSPLSSLLRALFLQRQRRCYESLLGRQQIVRATRSLVSTRACRASALLCALTCWLCMRSISRILALIGCATCVLLRNTIRRNQPKQLPWSAISVSSSGLPDPEANKGAPRAEAQDGRFLCCSLRVLRCGRLDGACKGVFLPACLSLPRLPLVLLCV